MPGNLELIQVTSETVSNSHVHVTFSIFPATCKEDRCRDHERCETNEALSVALDTSGGLAALVLSSLNVMSDWRHVQELYNSDR